MPMDHFCLSCAMTFATVAGLTMHAQAKDHIANPFVCDACEVSFASSTALESHKTSPKHANADESENDLDVSDDGVSKNGTFGDSDSTDSDPYCDGCERQFIDITALNQHLFNSLKHNWCFDCSRDFGLLISRDTGARQSTLVRTTFVPRSFESGRADTTARRTEL
ncbi:hypothetical protein BJ912DRAFT_117090 [Pholiota molesta]|nr:hypothetical protein BJ912DRAFT_117090 [Pholiota molesta]